jgi:hypothetical protein
MQKPNISKLHSAVLLVGKMHLSGYEGLRIMPVLGDDGSYKIVVGPRLCFSSKDGSFVPSDFRGRCVVFDGTEDKLNELTPREAIKQRYFLRGPQLSGDAQEPTAQQLSQFDEWLSHAKVKDPEYQHWFVNLCGRIAIDEFGLPYKKDDEAIAPRNSLFFARFKDDGGSLVRVGIAEPLTNPPVGKAVSRGPWQAKAPEVAVAQARPKEAPNLMWSVDSGKRGNTQLDEWFEDYTHRS